jgi:hypothetical protein
MTTLHYVDNKAFYDALVEYKAIVQDAKTNGLPTPRPSNYIGQCIIYIADKFSRSNNGRRSFSHYQYRDEMVSDAIENCTRAIGLFDPEKSHSPFSYFTQICFFAFIRRIQAEKKQLYIKHQIIKNVYLDTFDIQDADADQEFANDYIEFIRRNQSFDDSYFASYTQDKTKRTRNTNKNKTKLDEFFETEEPHENSISD